MTQLATIPDTQVVSADATSIMEVISRAAADPKTDVDKLERLLNMYERITAQKAQQRFNEAMTAVQNETRPIAADANNPQTKSKYASYPALDRILRPIYTNHGLALSFDTGDAPENHVKVLCHVSHSEGHAKTYSVLMPADGKGARGGDVMSRTHAAGAAMTYGQRYLLKLIFNIAVGGDDDGNGAGGTTGGLVSDEQIQTIKDLIVRSQADTVKFCAFMGVEAVRDIQKKDFDKAIIALNMKGRKPAP